jgi:transcription initiation factor TFIID TATA-box-binding protein
VATFSVPFKIDLIAFNYAKPKNSFYEPTTFPGLKFNPYSSEKTTVLIFISGKIVITGIKDVSKIEETKDYVSRILLRFKRPYPYTTLM